MSCVIILTCEARHREDQLSLTANYSLVFPGYFQGGQIDQQELQGKEVRAEFKFVSQVRVWRRHVEVEHGESPLVSVTLQHRSKVGVVVQFSGSHLQDFTGLLYQDTHSHLQLNLSLVEAAGTISGQVKGLGGTSQSLLLRLGQQRGNSSHQVKHHSHVFN